VQSADHNERCRQALTLARAVRVVAARRRGVRLRSTRKQRFPGSAHVALNRLCQQAPAASAFRRRACRAGRARREGRWPMLGFDQSVADGHEGELGLIGNAEFLLDVVKVRADG
jgi:hypothetical protein